MFKLNTEVGYYDPHPVIELDRHLAVIGLCSEETRTVAFRLAGLLGIPAVDLERIMEHSKGCSINELIFRLGEKSFRKKEKQTLYQVISSRPFGVVSLGDGALQQEGTRAKISSFCHLIAIERDLPGSYWYFRQRQSEGQSWHPLYDGELKSIEEIKPFYDSRRAVFEQALLRIRVAAGASPSGIAKDIYDQLVIP